MAQRIGKLAVFSLCLLLSVAAVSAQTPVFINEIHYDNTGGDVGEFIEIAGPAGTDLTGWSIVLYNGTGGVTYDTDALSGMIPNQQNGFGTVSISYPVNGIQNGSPDGIALFNGITVVQFLSYEGSFTATNGPANGMVSTDIGVSEAGTEPVGRSLQLQGTGQYYQEFTWTATAITATQNAVNAGQTLSPLTISVNDVTVTEGNAGTTTASFTVSLNRAAPGPVTFNIATQDDTATDASGDYVANSVMGGTIPATQTTFTFDVTVNGDVVFEPNETFFVNLTMVSGAVVGDAQGLGTINNDDGPPALSISDATVTEGNSGTVDATFTVTLSAAAGVNVTFDLATADQTATAGTDYVANSVNDALIPAGMTSFSFTVVVNGDVAFETNETFLVDLTDAQGAGVNDGQGVGTITNDDTQPSLSINDVTIAEGNTGPVNATFTVTLSAAAGVPVMVDYTTAPGTATAGSDYTTTSGTLTFAEGETTKSIDVPIISDMVPENDETFVVNLTNPVDATISDPQGAGTILNDDPISIAATNTAYSENFNSLANTGTSSTTPGGWYFLETGANANSTYTAGTGSSNTGDTYSFGAAASTERAFGGLRSGNLIPVIGALYRNDTGTTVTTLSITYSGEQWRLGTTGRVDRLDFQYSLDATNLATGFWFDVDPLDFSSPNTAAPSGTALDGNAAGNRTTVSFTITGLTIAPGDDFWIRYTEIDASGADDGLGVDDFIIIANIAGGGQLLMINDVTVTEGNSGTTTTTFTVSLSAPAGVGGVSFDISTADGTATVANNDYVAKSLTTQVIPEGSSAYMFTVDLNGDTTSEPNETFFVNVTNVVGAIVNDGQGQGTISNDDFTIVLIHDVQGSGNISPLIGSTVTVSGIVIGIKQGGSGGFFVQEEDAEIDADPNTSEGIFVFTGSGVPAGVVIGNRVAVTGVVSEFPTSAAPHGVTELTGPAVSVFVTGQPLPTPAVITAGDATPSANLSHYERYEGMRVATTLTVVSPTDGNVNEPNATSTSNGVFYGIPTGGARPFREPGHDLDTPLPASAPPNVPRFDTNPEKLRVDSDAQPGATQLNVAAGQTVANLIGPLDYGFFESTILPEAASVPVVTGPAAAAPVPAQLSSELTVASFNLERFYDTVDETSTPPGSGDVVLTATAVNNRLNKASLAIRNILGTPDVLGVIEVENLPTLQALAAKINNDAAAAGAPNPNYMAFLEEGNDIGGIDVGFLVKTVRVNVIMVMQFGKTTTFTDPGDGSIDILNDRPSLLLMGTINRPDGSAYPFTVIVNHLRSLIGVEEDNATGQRVRAKRAAQAEFLANFVQARQTADPAERIILVGDFNAFQFNDGLVDVIGTIKGTPTPADQVVVASPDLVNPDLVNLVDMVPADQRYSFLFDGNAQVLDHALVNQAFLGDVSRVFFAHVDADFPEIFRNDSTRPERISDHDAIVAYFDLTAALVVPAADVSITKTAPALANAGTNVQFNIAVANNGPDTATNVVVTDVLPAGMTFVSATPSQGSCGGTTTVTCALGSLASAATATVAITAMSPIGAGVIMNTASVTAAEMDLNPLNNSSTSTTTTVTAIPTMSEWMLLALAMSLLAAGALRLRGGAL